MLVFTLEGSLLLIQLCSLLHELHRFYYNRRTRLSTWEKPFELMTPLEVSHTRNSFWYIWWNVIFSFCVLVGAVLAGFELLSYLLFKYHFFFLACYISILCKPSKSLFLSPPSCTCIPTNVPLCFCLRIFRMNWMLFLGMDFHDIYWRLIREFLHEMNLTIISDGNCCA